MKLTILKQVEQEVEIDLPICLKYGDNLYVKVYNRNDAITINPNGISKSNIAYHYLSDTDYKECTESEFNNAYDTVLKNINDLKNK